MELQVLRVRDVAKKMGISKATLYRWIDAGEFPKPLRLGPRSVGWWSDDVKEWLRTRPESA